MSPQFVDFNADGHLDIVVGIFDGSPHVAFGDGKHWKQPETILDKEGRRIVLNAFWNYDDEKWDQTDRCDPEGGAPTEGHLTSAVAVDFDRDGDLDLVLGDYTGGHVYLRRNEGTSAEPRFATRNELVMSAGKPLREASKKIATLRAVDWNADGALDLLVGGTGDSYGAGGAGVSVFLNQARTGASTFGPEITLIAPGSDPSSKHPRRPDAGLHPEAVDFDGDGDLDLIVGGYSMWKPEARVLTEAEQTELAKLDAELAEVSAQLDEIFERLARATAGLEGKEEEAAHEEAWEAVSSDYDRLGTRQRELAKKIDELRPGRQRVGFTWLYENLSKDS